MSKKKRIPGAHAQEDRKEKDKLELKHERRIRIGFVFKDSKIALIAFQSEQF